MQLDNIIGNVQTVGALKTALRQGSLPHALLLCAGDGYGRGFTARCLAADYLFADNAALARAAMQGRCGELILVQGEGKSGQIPVGRIRAVRQEVFYSPLCATGRVVLLQNAHQLTASAANALLKVLEEPPANVLFILTARSSSLLPPTIASRCAIYSLAAVSRQQCIQALSPHLPQGAAAGLGALLADVYDNAIGLCVAALQSPQRLQQLLHAVQAAGAAGRRGSYTLLQVFSCYEGRTEEDGAARQAFLADLACILAACLRGKQAPGLPPIPPQAAALLLPPVLQAQRSLQRSAAVKLTFTALAVQLARAGQCS